MGTNYIAPIWRMPRNANKDKLSNYNIEFDGSRIQMPFTELSGATNCTISFWAKIDYSANVEPKYPFHLTNGTDNPILWVFNAAGTSLDVYIGNVNFRLDGSFNKDIAEWNHWVLRFDGSETSINRTRVYQNGQQLTSQSGWGTATSIPSATNLILAGRNLNATQWYYQMPGNMSQCCIFDYTLSENQISYLYNLNNPMAITGGEPVAYWPLGDNSNPNAPASFPNISVGADSVFNFNGSSTWINVPDNDLLSFGGASDSPFSMSAWIKTTGYGDGIISRWGNTSGSGSGVVGYEYILYVQRTSSTASTARLRLALYDQGTGTPTNGNVQRRDSVTIINTGEWVHIVATYDGRGGNGTNTDTALLGITMYINGVPESSYIDSHGGSYFNMRNSNRPTEIGVYNDTSSVVFNGEITNAQVWNQELNASQALELYNNGQPLMTGTQPQETNLRAWYKLNQSANWEADSTGNWQIPDAVSSYPQSFNFSKTPQEYIDLGKDDWFNEYNNEITFSVWINKKNWSSTGFESIISKYGSASAAIQYRIAYPSSAGKLQFYLQGGPSGGPYSARINTVTLTSAQTNTNWLHILWRHSASTSTSQVIFNGDHANAVSLTNIAANPYARPQTTTLNMIGNVSNGLQPFDGAISNYQRFNSYLDNAAVEALYNEGVPSTTAIATDNLKAWYKLDNNEKFDGTNWSVENQKYPASFDSALDFNGTSDSFSIASPYSTLANKSAFSISFWFKQIDFLYNRTVLHQGNGILFRTSTNNKLFGNIYTFTSKTLNSNTFNENEWQHFMLIYDGSSLKLYQNGDVADTDTGVSGNTPNTTGLLAWASHTNLSANHNECQISNIAVWDTDQTTEVANIYNNGTPATSYTNTPNNWYKLDNTTTGIQDSTGSNNGTNNGATKVNTFVSTEAATSSGMTEQSLVNNNVSVLNGESSGMNTTNLVQGNLTRKQPYSSYSMNLDSADNDYIRVPNPGSIFAYGESAFTFSGWVSIDAYSDQDGIFSRFYSAAWRSIIKLNFSSPFNGLMFQVVKNNANAYLVWNGILPNPANGEWKHICLTYDAGNVKLYLDGIDQGPGTATGTIPTAMPDLTNFNPQIEIGRDSTSAAQRVFNGRVSNFCVFDRALSESEALKIYNNGITQNLQKTSSFSNNILAWWPMDENSSYYNGNDWVVRDIEGGKDGIGINTGNVDDLVGNAPGSEASGTGTNLAIADLKGNMYNSDKNAFSINMADYADGVTNPANSGRSTDTP